jgi:hypothetical protein
VIETAPRPALTACCPGRDGTAAMSSSALETHARRDRDTCDIGSSSTEMVNPINSFNQVNDQRYAIRRRRQEHPPGGPGRD